jgi:hypothetical protein
MRSLWPPIEVIASNLQTGSEPALHFPASTESGSDAQVDAMALEMPAFIRDKVRQRLASRAAQFDTQPRAGQIWRFDGKPDELAPLCVLIDQDLGNHHWLGWIAASETDYASNKDVLLEPQDEPFDPLGAMVQTWNPVEVDVRKAARVLAQLGLHRLEAIREVAGGKSEEGGGARAGFVAPLKTQAGVSVLSGTRITHADDPRRQYQTLYGTAARTLEQQLGTTKVVPLPQRRNIVRKAGWAIAACVMLAQAVIIANMMQEQSNYHIYYQTGFIGNVPQDPDKNHLSKDVEAYRSSPVLASDEVILEVFFKPDAKAVDIRKLMTRLNANIVAGPGEFGQYRVKVKLAVRQEAAELIKASGLVDAISSDEINQQ